MQARDHDGTYRNVLDTWPLTWENVPSNMYALRRLESAYASVSVASVFVVRMKKLCIIVYPNCRLAPVSSD